MSGAIDLDMQENYPIVLSDALLGRGTKEIFTSIRCTIRHRSPPLNMLIRAP